MSKLEDEFEFQCRSYKLKPIREYRFHPIRRWRWDFAYPESWVAVELDGAIWVSGRHARGSGILSDMDKYNAGLLLGWKPFRFSASHVKSGEAIQTILEALK